MAPWNLSERYETPHGTVRWTSWGQGSPVVFLHGTPFSSYVWRDIAAGFSTRHTVFLWDLLGYGQSEMREGQDVSLAAQGRIFAELLTHWGLTDPLVVAHDFGGTVALRAHLLHGVRYRKLTLVDPVALAPWGSSFFRLVNEHSTAFGQLPPALHRALVREYVSSASSPGLHPATLERLIEPWLGEHGQPAFYRQIAQAHQRYTDEIQDLYDTIDIPVLVCWGADDTWVPATKGHELTSRITDARLRLIPTAGHLVQEDAPAQLTGALTDFLDAP